MKATMAMFSRRKRWGRGGEVVEEWVDTKIRCTSSPLDSDVFSRGSGQRTKLSASRSKALVIWVNKKICQTRVSLYISTIQDQ